MYHHTKIFVSAFAISAMVAGSAAAGILIDFGAAQNGSQTTAGNWNNIERTTVGAGNQADDILGLTYNLIDDTGADSGIDMVITDTASGAGFDEAGAGANWNGPYPAAISSQPMTALQDGLFLTSANTATLTFAGLNDALTYTFTMYGARGNTGSADIFTPTIFGSNSGPASITNVLMNSTEVASITGTSTGGAFAFVWSTPGAGGSLNFMSISTVPEPGSLTLFGLSGLVGLGVRRRRC
jgi:PEP-CTERM motif